MKRYPAQLRVPYLTRGTRQIRCKRILWKYPPWETSLSLKRYYSILSELGIKNVVSKGGDNFLLPLPTVKDTVPRTVVLSRLPDSYCRGALDHSPARVTFPKDEIRREHAHNGPKIIKGKMTLAKKGTPRGSWGTPYIKVPRFHSPSCFHSPLTLTLYKIGFL